MDIKGMTVMLAVMGLAVIVAPQADAASLVDRVTSALQGSFDALNSKRNEWFNNYSTMDNMTKTSSTHLRELLLVSKLALPLMWQMYTTSVKKQKKFYEKVMEEGPQSLPFHGHVTSTPLGPYLHLEATLLQDQHRDFQVEIFKEMKEIFLITFKFEERRAVMGHRGQNGFIEKAVLADDHFPAITLNTPFRINVQIFDDCIVASIWVNNLNLATPMPLPEKHTWCTRDYTNPTAGYTVNIHTIDGSQEEYGSQEEHGSQEEYGSQEEHGSQEEYGSQESHEENDQQGHEGQGSGIRLVSAVVYAGPVFQ